MASFYEGNLDTFKAVIHGEAHPNTARFLENMVDRPSMAIGAASQAFMGRAREVYDQVSGSNAMRRIRAAGRQIGSQWDRNEIRPLLTVPQLQVAPLKMQRWLMAEPTVRKLYHSQQCDGYSEQYIDNAPGDIGDSHYDYRRVMNGIVAETEDGWVSTEYLDDIPDDDIDLEFDQQYDILRSWSTIAAAVMRKEDDPTSIYNAEL
jgi:hypothetical protein